MLIKQSLQNVGLPALAFLTFSGAWSQSLPEKPNILLIITDQQSSESMSNRIGTSYLKTPNMDYLADNGVSFTNAYCANPLSIPSRSSMFTGRYPHEVGIQSNDNKLIDPKEFPSLGTIFSEAGYETGYVGKWHLPFNRKLTDSHGFAYLPDLTGNGDDNLSPGLAIKFLEKDRQQPFFLVVSFMNPHNICQWARGEELPDGPIGDPPVADQCPPLRTNHDPSLNETDIMKLIRTSFQASPTFPVSGFDDGKWRQYIWAYYRMIEKVDGEIGQVIKALQQSGLEKNTVIVFLSDHGDMQGAHHWNQKTVFYEEASKVPFIISSPAIKAAKSDWLVQTGIDLMPTLCDLAGIPLNTKLPGTSLKQIVSGTSSSVNREYIVVSDHMVQGEPVNGHKPEPEGRMLRNNRFKYWVNSEGEQRETLFDLKNDPGEMVNIAGDTKYLSDLESCRKQLYGWAQDNSDPFIKYLIK